MVLKLEDDDGQGYGVEDDDGLGLDEDDDELVQGYGELGLESGEQEHFQVCCGEKENGELASVGCDELALELLQAYELAHGVPLLLQFCGLLLHDDLLRVLAAFFCCLNRFEQI